MMALLPFSLTTSYVVVEQNVDFVISLLMFDER